MLKPKHIWLVCEPVDMRQGIDTLTQIAYGLSADTWQQGTTFIFRNVRGHRIKVLYWDPHGVWLCQRRLHHVNLTDDPFKSFI